MHAAHTSIGGLSSPGAPCSFTGINHAGLSHTLINHFRLWGRSPERECIMYRKTPTCSELVSDQVLCTQDVAFLFFSTRLYVCLCFEVIPTGGSAAVFHSSGVCEGAAPAASRCCCGAAAKVLLVFLSVFVCFHVFYPSVCAVCWCCVNGCTDKCCRCAFADVWTLQC